MNVFVQQAKIVSLDNSLVNDGLKDFTQVHGRSFSFYFLKLFRRESL